MPWKRNDSGNWGYGGSGPGVCFTCGKPYDQWPDIGCQYKTLHEPYQKAHPSETQTTDEVAWPTDQSPTQRLPSAPTTNEPKLIAGQSDEERRKFIIVRLGQLRKELDYAKRANSNKSEESVIKDSIQLLERELAALNGEPDNPPAPEPELSKPRQRRDRPVSNESRLRELESELARLKSSTLSYEREKIDAIEREIGVLRKRINPHKRSESTSASLSENTSTPTMERNSKTSDFQDDNNPPIIVESNRNSSYYGQSSRRSKVYRQLRRKAWSFLYLALFLGLSIVSYYDDLNSGLQHSDFYIGNFALVIWSLRVPLPLIVYSLIFAFVLYIPLRTIGWGAKQITRRRYTKGILAVIFIVIITGFAVSNSPYSSVIPPTSAFYQGLQSMEQQLANQSPSTVSTVGTVTPTLSFATSAIASSESTPTGPRSGSFWLADNPDINGTSAIIDTPSDYGILANYALGLINSDREQAGLSNVTLSPIESAQQHADSMAYFGYFSHWDPQGYKPYARYTILGGTGYVAENAGMDYCTNASVTAQLITPVQCTLQTIENGVGNSEYAMMNYDAACCNNGHRDNILGASHNEVSIGIAWNQNTDAVYFVEDFQDVYISNLSLQTSGDVVTLQGTTQEDLTGWTGDQSGASINVYYDPSPGPIPVSELDQSSACASNNEFSESAGCQYAGAYGLGTPVTTVLAPCPAGSVCGSHSGFSYAQTWDTSGTFKIVFTLPQLGNGIYTLYLWPVAANEPITSLSVFMNQ